MNPKAESLSLDGCYWASTGRAWLTSQSRGGELENQCVFLSSLRELCLSLAIAVCHATERRGHTPSSRCVSPSSPWIDTDPQKGKHVILLFSHGAKKAPLIPRELYSSPSNRLSSFIYLSIRLPVFTPRHLLPAWLTDDLSIALVDNQ